MTGEKNVAEEKAGDERRLLEALCLLDSTDEAEAFLRDLCTPREMSDLAQRLEVARLLAEGTSYAEVSRATGASSTTVSRVSKCLNGARGGYRMVLARLGLLPDKGAEGDRPAGDWAGTEPRGERR